MLSEGIATSRGRAGALVHRDAVNRRLRGRRGARLAALTSGGAIPDNANYDVVLEPEGTVIGNVDEDFAIESMAGDIILLGNSSWRIRRVEPGRVRVEDAAGAAPTIPFWLGEGPARTRELSAEVAALREEIAGAAARGEDPAAALMVSCALDRRGAELLRDYVVAGATALGGRAHPDAGDRRALLRRRGRHAAGHPRAVRRPDQPRLGHGAAQAVLPVLRLRAAGGGDRRRHRAVARAAAQLPARGRVLDAACRRRRGAAGASCSAGADVRDALALERDAIARAAAQPRRPARPPCPAAHARAGSDRRGVPGADGVPGQSRRRADRDPRPPAGARDRARLPRRGDGRGRPARGAGGARRRTHHRVGQRAARAVGVCARDPERQPVRVPRRRAAGRAANARGRPPPRSARHGGRADRRPRSGGRRGGGGRGAARSARRRRASRSAARCRRAARRRSGGSAAGWTCSTRSSRTGGRARLEGDPCHWVAAERRSVAAAVWPARRFTPDVVEPPSRRAAPADADSALAEIVRGHVGAPRSDDGGSARRAPGRAPVRRRCGAGAAGDGRRGAARTLPGRRRRRRDPVVRPAAARAHQPPHARRTAPRDRAGQRRRLPPVPVRLAARAAGQPAARPARVWRA